MLITAVTDELLSLAASGFVQQDLERGEFLDQAVEEFEYHSNPSVVEEPTMDNIVPFNKKH